MIREALVECSFLIPIRRDANLSDGAVHSPEAWGWLGDELFTQFHGRTLAPGLYEGSYQDPDTKQRVSDEARRYIVAVPNSSVDQLRGLLARACVVFQQKCIYLSVAGQVEFVEAVRNEPDQGVR